MNKWLMVAVAALFLLGGSMFVRHTVEPKRAVHQVDFFDSGSQWDGFQFDGFELGSERDQLYQSKDLAFLSSPAIATKFPFNELVLTWNCLVPDTFGLYVEVCVSRDQKVWHRFAYQSWGEAAQDILSTLDSSAAPYSSEVGYVDIDILRLFLPMKFYRFEVGTKATGGPFLLDRITICYSNTKADAKLCRRFAANGKNLKPVALPVPFYSQGALPDSIAGRTCSPVSLAMVLNYHNRPYSPLAVAAAVYDPNHDIYGNWPYNIAAAYLLGMKKSWLARHNSFSELVDELLVGCPVIISISVPRGKLKGAPYRGTGGGHLIVVRGIGVDGKILANDPAGDDPAEGMVAYDLRELTEVWVSHGGIAYHLWPGQ